jgi:uncharacterized protein (DUF952 family)
MEVILHITEREQWDQAELAGVYHDDTLHSEGFIHCSTLQQVIQVANALFRAQEGLVLLCIAPDRVEAEIRYESTEGGERFPHIYGPLNIDAVIKALEFEPDEAGKFELPGEVHQ